MAEEPQDLLRIRTDYIGAGQYLVSEDESTVIVNTDYGVRPDTLARELEARGFESFWVGEHTHIPADRRSPYPGGGELPRPYYHMIDPFVSLTAAASVTTNLKLGTGICLVIERDPITLAKEVASLDLISDGRFLFGIGGGWNIEEMENQLNSNKEHAQNRGFEALLCKPAS